MKFSEKAIFGAKQTIEKCLAIKPCEKFCIIADEETYLLAKLLEEMSSKITGNIKIFKMEDFGERPEDGSNPLKFPKEIADYLKTCDVSMYIAGAKNGERDNFRRPMLKITVDCGIRHAHMAMLSTKTLETGMCVDYDIIKKISMDVYNIVSKAKIIKVTTKRGTNFTAEFNPNWKWEADYGFILPGHWKNLPDGEVFTCMKTANGKIVADGILGDYMYAKFGLINATPLILEVKDGIIVSIESKNKDMENEVKKYTKMDENAKRVGEFGIGTNVGLKELICNPVQDEKFPGVHIAIGNGNPEITGSDWDSAAHCDCIISNTNIEVDGRTIMKEGKFLI